MAKAPEDYIDAIRSSGLSIYDEIEVGDPDLWIPTEQLGQILKQALVGKSLSGLPLRTRSKVAKTLVCKALGYPVPKSFKRTRPDFPGQNFDLFVQKSNNLQIWNDEVSLTRRYVLVRLDANDKINSVRVVLGDVIASLDTTGTLTTKYQATCTPGDSQFELVTNRDTNNIESLVNSNVDLQNFHPTDNPRPGELLPISELMTRLTQLIGTSFPDTGYDQERNRGSRLHELVCRTLGYPVYHDNGQFPDVRHQLMEIKLQTSPTIDLGLVLPSSSEPIDMPKVGNVQVRHCDVRYAVFYGRIENGSVTLTHLMLTTGEMFFSRFRQFEGKTVNSKLQIPLPPGFFDVVS